MTHIKLRNVSLEFPVVSESGSSIRNQLVRLTTGGKITKNHNKTVLVKALNDVSLEIKDGDRVGLVGHNGSGKSTLLRVLAGVYTPTQGECLINGEVRSLFELGVGLDHELSGIENINRLFRLNGFPLDGLKEGCAEIESFSGLGGYLRLPVRTYSSGMQLRLLFAISTLYPSDILLIDEVFGVGDSDFQEKAKVRLVEMMDRSSVVVLASHSNEIIRKFCNKIVTLSAGSVVDMVSI